MNTYKLLLVDDEEDVRQGVVQEIDWALYGFEVVDVAENGREALELMEKHVPDVVVTDIQMPFMNGLQLSEQIREHYPTTKIIILTGYDEFEYAQKAIKMHIDEYVLKPFSSLELIQILIKVKLQMDEEAAQKKDVYALKEHYRKSLPVLREVFLASLVTHPIPLIEIKEKSEHYRIDLTGDGYVVSVISIDNYQDVIATDQVLQDSEDAAIPSISLKDSEDLELKRFAIFNIAEEIVHKHNIGKVFIHNDYVVILSIHQPTAAATATMAVRQADPRQVAMDATLTALEEVRQSIEKYLKFTVTMGVGTASTEITDMKYAYDDAVLALDYRLILGNNRLICIDDVESRFVEKVRFDELREHALVRCIKVGTITELHEIVEEMFRELTAAQVTIQDCQIYLLEILTSILKAGKDARMDLDEVFGSGVAPFAEVYKFQHLLEAKQRILQICTQMIHNISSDRQTTYVKLVDKAKEFTKLHYHDSDLSIHRVCQELHISSGYFSTLFKKEVKMTFVSYLMHIRMEAAKEMLRTTDLKALEVAEKVGFAESNYFSFCFKKHFHISPKEYRNSDRGD